MRRATLVLFVLVAIWSATPASAQHLYMDSTGDGVCTHPFEPLSSTGPSSVDIWIDTSGPAMCSGGEPISITGYEIVMQAGANGSGTVFNGWVNSVAAFTAELGSVQSGGVYRVGFYSGSVYLPPGKHQLGTVTFTYAGSCPSVGIRQFATILGTEYVTQFLTECPTSDSDYILSLGEAGDEPCTAGPICSDVLDSTWGEIKSRYR